MKKTSVSSFETNQDTGLYFWRSGSEPNETQFSSHPHPSLQFHCKKHNWWSDKICPPCHGVKLTKASPVATVPDETEVDVC
jgi:hypothetical protein